MQRRRAFREFRVRWNGRSETRELLGSARPPCAFAVPPGTGEIQTVPVAADELYPQFSHPRDPRSGPQGGIPRVGAGQGRPGTAGNDSGRRADLHGQGRCGDGGIYGQSPFFAIGFHYPDGTALNDRSIGIDPAAAFETIGITSRSNTSGK